MKKYFVFFIFIIIAINMNSCADNRNAYTGLGEEDKLLYRFINSEGKRLGKKYNMIQCCNGLAGMDKVERIAISFNRYGIPLTEEEARILIIDCVEDFLKAINKDEKLKVFLRDYPFTAKNIDMAIYNFDKDNKGDLYPSIAVVSNYEGKIGYFTNIKSKLSYHTKKYESFEEAVAILKKEKTNKL